MLHTADLRQMVSCMGAQVYTCMHKNTGMHAYTDNFKYDMYVQVCTGVHVYTNIYVCA